MLSKIVFGFLNFILGFIVGVTGCTRPIRLYRLVEGYGGLFGAAVLGAKQAGFKINVNHEKIRTVLDTIPPQPNMQNNVA